MLLLPERSGLVADQHQRTRRHQQKQQRETVQVAFRQRRNQEELRNRNLQAESQSARSQNKVSRHEPIAQRASHEFGIEDGNDFPDSGERSRPETEIASLLRRGEKEVPLLE